MLSNPIKLAAPAAEPPPARTGRRLISAAALIALALGTLTLVDRFREVPVDPAPPNEPSQALITTPAPETAVPTTSPEPAIDPPPPPQVTKDATLTPPPSAPAVLPPAAMTHAAPVEKDAGKAYMVQVGVFTSPANAEALQKQLRRAGINAHLETRVRLGPFKDKREAEKILARAKKLGINAVLIGSR
jgi:cell division protein FtsN